MAGFLSSIIRNLTPVFRYFINAEDNAGNLPCTFQKNNEKAAKNLKIHRIEDDPRDILHVWTGAQDRERLLVIPTSSWTTEPEKQKIVEYSYDHLSSVDFKVEEDFPFFDFVFAISGKSSYEMVSSIRDFYKHLGQSNEEEVLTPALIRERYKEEIVCRMYCCKDHNFTYPQIGLAFGVSEKSAKNWVKEYRKTHPELPNNN